MEKIKIVSHQQAAQLLHNKFVVVLGSSVQRSVYKDIVLLLQKDKYLSIKQLKSKGEGSFEQDCLVEGGSLNPLNNGTGYREVRQFQSDHHLVRFYFLTKIYSSYLQSVLNDFRSGLKPDIIIANSCVWDISRYNSNWSSDYEENLHQFFEELREILPEESLIIWNLTMPLGQNIRGGFLVPEIEHKALQLSSDVIKANFLSGTVADSFGVDVVDFHYHFRHSLQHRTNDGVHWNALAHRCMTSLLLEHTAQAWGVAMPCPVRTGESEHSNRTEKGFSEEFTQDSLSEEYISFEENVPQPPSSQAARDERPPPRNKNMENGKRNWKRRFHSNRNDSFADWTHMPPNYYSPSENHWDYHCHSYHHHHHHHHHHPYVMRNQWRRNYYAPYPPQFNQHNHYSQYY